MTTIGAYAALAAKESLSPYAYEPAPLGPRDIEIAISHCGVCHSDLHLIDNDWASSTYPLVPGHEIVGTVSAAGSEAALGVGQRVGVGWQRSACHECEAVPRREREPLREAGGDVRRPHGRLREAHSARRALRVRPPRGARRRRGRAAALRRRHGVRAAPPLGRAARGCAWASSASAASGTWRCGSSVPWAARPRRSPRRPTSARRLRASAPTTRCPRRTPASCARKRTASTSSSCTVPARLDWIAYLRALKPNGVLCLVGAPPGLLQVPAARC